jgi:hypothetical protein
MTESKKNQKKKNKRGFKPNQIKTFENSTHYEGKNEQHII